LVLCCPRVLRTLFLCVVYGMIFFQHLFNGTLTPYLTMCLCTYNVPVPNIIINRKIENVAMVLHYKCLYRPMFLFSMGYSYIYISFLLNSSPFLLKRKHVYHPYLTLLHENCECTDPLEYYRRVWEWTYLNKNELFYYVMDSKID